jgi:hypothetical protein
MRCAIVAVIVLAFVCFGSPAFAVAQGNESSSTPSALRIVQLLEDTGLNYEQRSPTSWMVLFKGSAGDDIPVFVAPADAILALVAIVATGAETRESVELYRALLKFNIDADYIKAGIDDDGDFQIGADVKLASLSGQTLKELLDQLATGVNQLRPLFLKHRKQ